MTDDDFEEADLRPHMEAIALNAATVQPMPCMTCGKPVRMGVAYCDVVCEFNAPAANTH